MRKYLFIIVFLFLTIKINSTFLPDTDYSLLVDTKEELTEWDKFIEALIFVESKGNLFAVGKSNDVGVLQITPIYVKEVNRLQSEKVFSLEDRYSREKSIEMFEIMQTYYNPEKSIEKAIKLHNPRAGKEYYNSIVNKLKSL